METGCGAWLVLGTSPAESGSGQHPPSFREFTKGGLVKGGLAIYAFPLRNCNTLGSAFNAQIENMPNCKTLLY